MRPDDLSAGAARLGIDDALRRIDRARAPLGRTEPDEAARTWEGLVDGRWSVVERLVRPGKRLVLARRNAPGDRERAALSPREREVAACAAMGHQNKYIAYLLGISISAVAAHLRGAQRKLRVASRAELIRHLGALASPPR